MRMKGQQASSRPIGARGGHRPAQDLPVPDVDTVEIAEHQDHT
jgi:hypothetical protein